MEVVVPESRFERAVFGGMMALVMVYGMEVYNVALRHGVDGGAVWRVPLGELAGLSCIVMILQEFVGGPLARRLARLCVDPRTAPPTLTMLSVSVFTVFCMCPLMSFVTTLLFQGAGEGLVQRWLAAFRLNLPMAFTWQVFVAGPLVRRSFRALFVRAPLR
jgi:hypothetical protein